MARAVMPKPYKPTTGYAGPPALKKGGHVIEKEQDYGNS